MSTVHQRRRHYSEIDNGRGTYTHEVLVSYEVEEASNWSCRRPFRYHNVLTSPPTELDVHVGKPIQLGLVEKTDKVASTATNPPIEHSIDVHSGRPIQPGLELIKTDDNARSKGPFECGFR